MGEDTQKTINKLEDVIRDMATQVNGLATNQAVDDERQRTVLERLAKIDAKLEIQNGRVAKLENWRAYLAGGMAVIIVGLPIIIKLWVTGSLF